MFSLFSNLYLNRLIYKLTALSFNKLIGHALGCLYLLSKNCADDASPCRGRVICTIPISNETVEPGVFPP